MADPIRFLIADDEALHNLALTSQLEALGHEVVATAANGREAVELARDKKPDMAILDIRMPVQTGPEAAHEIHQERPIPIIILSAYSDTRTVETATRSPIFHYLVKPVDPDDLAPAIAVAKARFDEWMRARQERDALELKLEERKVVERAKGILMETRGFSEQEAYRFLQKTSQDRNTPMVDLAKKILLAAPLLKQE
ncbi:MAG: response regulator [Gemmatimonadetes bacterium]|nr:response regulator [Gemmatimonadota bacterium]NIQ56372.1 response regulator [Gemmatimonadota bacterium]NIU76568.1 response regulator [Gammaproteobacteria bacterium]NIX46018.1 response regulator [Gemmatimonadota bacterium]NIY10335.1 response regulator [Gemmatimonadota bacterium]